ncbi:protein kinase [Peterkaempfera sp. SMS 1(5)a]|uniref:serine/threonine-protein kinase n=1 Tax=Peterkaempfera podocarpi TaxID=3232308 RepID=UPI00366B02E7
MTQAQGSTGRLIAGRYRLDSVLGRGGMGTVWRAEDEMLGRVVAVKELRFHGGVDDEEKRRLITRTLREAKATARIRHTAAVTVFDVVDEDDRPWIVMELVESRSLSDVIKQDGPLEPVRAAEIGLALLGVLRSAHGHGILHRDVKPSNVLIGDDGRVVLTDFGIASVEGDPSVTSTGMLVGAPSYISPERARGQKPGPPADLWSLGATLYAMVEGKPPYDRGSAISTLTAVMMEDLKTPANAGPLRPVIEGLLHKDPDERLDESTTRSMLRRIVAEATRRSEDTTQQASAARTQVLPATPAEEKPAEEKPVKKKQAEEKPAAGKPAGDAARSVPRQGAQPEKSAQGAKSAPAGKSAPAKEATPAKEASPAEDGGEAAESGRRGAGVLGGLLGTVRVGSRTAPPSADPAEPAATAVPAAPEPAATSEPAEAARPARPAAAAAPAGAAKPAEPTAAPAPAPAQEEAPATAVLPAAVAAESGAPGGPGSGVGRRVREWRAAPPAERTPAPRTLLVYGLVLVLLVTAVVLGVQAMSDTGGSSGDRASGGAGGSHSPAPKASTSATGGAPTPSSSATGPAAPAGDDPTGDDKGGGDNGDGNGNGDQSGPGSGSKDGGAKGAVPDGFTTYTNDREGLSVVVPEGMTYAKDKDGGVELHYKDWVLILDHRQDATEDVLADWRDRASQASAGYPEYHQVGGIQQLRYRGWDAADWTFTFNKPVALKHVVSRAFIIGKDTGKAYLIQWMMPQDQWDSAEAAQARRLSYDSFKPLG